jgi:glucose-6-phosphate 1-epimerase
MAVRQGERLVPRLCIDRCASTEEEGAVADLEVRTAQCAGRITDHGAQVLGWAPSGESAVLWLSSSAVFADDVAIRGGIPICFPWFGSGRSGALAPAHGFARLVPWRRLSSTDDDGVVTVVHELTPPVGSCPDFPYAYRAVLTACFGQRLDLALAIHNEGEVAFDYEAALHTYLAVADATALRIEGLEGAPYLDKVTGTARVQEGPITISGEVDRVYRSDGTVVVVDTIGDRRIVVAKDGSRSTIVWNPGQDRARALADFGEAEWNSMVCVETANVGDDAIRLEPGASHRMTVQVSVAALNPDGAAPDPRRKAPECST